MKVITHPTPNYHGYNVKFSPFQPNCIACATSTNYGISGSGALLILEQTANGDYYPTISFKWRDGLFDVSWSKIAQNFLATCSGDASIQIWNTLDPTLPSTILYGHRKEVYGVEFGTRVNPHSLLSASADSSICLWDVNAGREVNCFHGHEDIVYCAHWAPHMIGVFASVGGDGSLRLWDTRAPDILPQIINAHCGDALTCDWDLLNEHTVATGGVDTLIHIWDLRNPDTAVASLVGHELAVRRVKFSPFHRNLLASVSYDFTTRFWDSVTSMPKDTFCYHTEFVYGLDFNLHVPDMVADCGWDALLHVYEGIDFGL